MSKKSATELFEQYYKILIYSLPMKDATFMDELLANDLLTGYSKIKLESFTMHNQRASYFLDNVIKPELAVDSRSFVSLLTIMKSNEHDNVKELAKEIENELAIDIKYPSKPVLRDLHNILIPKIANDWYEVGIQLFDDSQLPKLDEIRATYSSDRRGGCVEMLKYWLRITPEATWDNLIHALRQPGLELFSLADDVEKKVKSKCARVNTEHMETPKKPQSQFTLDPPDAYAKRFEDDDVTCAFAYLFNKLGILFGEVDFTVLKRACIQRGTLLSSDFKQQIKAANELDDLLDALDNPMYCNWLNTRLLKRIVKTIDIPEAEQLIQVYENCVYSRKVSDVMEHFDSKCFNPSHVSLVDAKINTKFESLTVADIIKYCQKLERNIGVCAGSVTAVKCQPGCLQITCVIPMYCAFHAYETAKTNFLKFRQFHIQYTEIESFPKVFALRFPNNLTSAQETSQVINHYYSSLENYMDADSVSHMMHYEHLITDDDYEAITAAPNDHKMNIVLLQYVKSMNVNQLFRFCEIFNSIETHKIIEDCSSISFQVVLQKLSTTVRVSISQQSMVTSIKCMKMSEVHMVFYDLVDHLFLRLCVTEKFFFDVIRKCTVNSSFTEQWLRKISSCKSLHLFKIYLLPFITWLDHSVLKDLVVASGSEDAQQLLNLFDTKIESYCRQPISSFPMACPSQLMIPLDDSDYTILSVKFRPPSRRGSTQGMIILQDIMEIKLTLKRKWKIRSHDIQLVAVHTKFELLYWMIPKCLVKLIESNLVHDRKSGIIMMAVLPPIFLSDEDGDSEKLKGPFSSLNFLWQDDTEVLSSTSLQSKLENIDTQNLAQQYLQLQDKIKIIREENEKNKVKLNELESLVTTGTKLRDTTNLESKMKQQSAMSEDLSETLGKSRKFHQRQIKYSSELNIHQLMNIVPLIQEKWSFIGTRLKLSATELDEIWQASNEELIPIESKNTFCCIKMLTRWFEASDDVSVDAIIMAVDAPHVGLRTRISSIEAALTSEYIATESCVGTNPPQRLEQPYFDMITKFCVELSRSQHSISDILAYLKVCKINSDVYKEISDFPELVESLEQHKLSNKTDLSWLKNIAYHTRCTKATEVIEEYENLLLADKIPWYKSHTEGTFLVGRTDKKPESVTIKDSSNAKLAASRIVNIKESDSILDSSEVGSVTYYWRVVDKAVRIKIPKAANASLLNECKNSNLTHVGVMIDGNLNLTNVDEIVIEDGQLHALCKDGKYKQIKEFLQTYKADLPAILDYRRGVFGYTPIHEAVSRGHSKVLELLLDHGGNPNCHCNGGYTPLHLAASSGHINCIRVLLDNNADITRTDEYGKTPIQTAELSSKHGVIKVLKSADSEHGKCMDSLKHRYLNKINEWETTKWPHRLQIPTLYEEIIIVKAQILPERLHKECAMGLIKTNFSHVAVEDLLQDSHEKVILIEGDPGAGKTTVTLQICKEWAENKILKEDIVFWIPLCHFKSVNTVYELFHKLGYPEMAVFAQQNNGKGLVLILDGWDELPYDLQTKSLFYDIIFGKVVFSHSTIIVTSRPTCCVNIYEETEKKNSYYRILGFDQKKATDYIKTYFKNDPSSGESLLTFLHSHEYLSQDFYIPISVTIMCFVYHSNDKKIPPTLSRFYEMFVILCLCSNVSDTQDLEKFKTIHDLPDKMKPIFHKLCKMAYEMLKDDKLLLNEKDMPDDIKKLEKFDGFGLLHVDHYLSTLITMEKSYSFTHRVIQEFLAAWFIFNDSINNTVDNYFKKDSRLMNVLPFSFGLVPKEQLKSLTEELMLFYNSNRNDKLLSNDILLSILHCLFEAHDERLCREFGQGFNGQDINLYIHTFLDCHYACYFIKTCGIEGLNICMCRCNYRASTDFYCDTIAKYLQDTSADISSFYFNIYGALSHKGITEFAKILPAQPNIGSLELIGSCVPGCLKILCDSISKHNHKITNLRLPNGKLNEHDLENIGFVLNKCVSLKNLYACCEPNEGVCLTLSSSFCKALCDKNSSLIKLVLPWWILSEAESEVFGNIIKQNCRLEELWINVATVTCLDPILNGLSFNASITTFRTWPDKTGTSNTLGQCFSNCLCHNHSLKVIEFNDALSMLRPPLYIAWSSTQVSSVCADLCTNTKLVTLDISGSYIDTEACHAVCSMLSQNKTLQHLFLNPVHLEKEEAIAMIDGCKSNSTLKLLSLIQWGQRNLLLKNLFQFSTDEDVEFAIQQMQKVRKQKNKPILHIYWKCDNEYDEVKEQILPAL